MAMYNDISVPRFKSKQNRLYGDLLGKQLGFVEGAAEGLDPYSMAEGFRTDANRTLADDSTGTLLAEQTGDEGAQAAYELAGKNQVTSQYNDLLAFYNSPEGRLQIARAKAGLYGPETLSALQLLPSGYTPPGGPKGQGSFINKALEIGSMAGGMGWSPFG